MLTVEQMLIGQNIELSNEVKRLTKERDAAVRDITTCCDTCAHETENGVCNAKREYCIKSDNSYWDWRGVQEDEE